jgi:hypothetical protein
MNRLLIIACSQRKKPDPGYLPAIDRYDGPAFRVLRNYLSGSPADAPSVLILSAEYGLIESSRPIPNYDRLMSAARAKELRASVLDSGRPVLERGWGEIAVCVGKNYRAALGGLLEHTPEGVPVCPIGGGLGQRLSRLRTWLRVAGGKEG